MDWKEISVFISSTFNDMHAERDYVIKNVFPQLEEWCEKNHIFLRDIDLRWGVTLKDSQTQNTIYKCLTAVDSCRPFFFCFLGQRRGWVPSLDRINRHTQETFPEIVEMARSKSHSATEYEIEHALLMPLAFFEDGILRRSEPVKNAVFLRRKPDYLKYLSPAQKKIFLDYQPELCSTPEDYAAYLDSCRKANEKTYSRITEKNFVLDYECHWNPDIFSPELNTDAPDDDRAQGRLTDFIICSDDLPSAMRECLLDILRKYFPDDVPTGTVWQLKSYLLAAFVMQFVPFAHAVEQQDIYAADEEQQLIFRNTCLKDAVARDNISREILSYCDSKTDRPLLILADAGMGKTTIIAKALSEYKGAPVLYRFLGVSDLSGSLFTLWNSVLKQTGISEQEDWEAIKSNFSALLTEMAPRILVFDGLDQIPGGIDLINLFSVPLPPGIKVILSAQNDYKKEELNKILAFHSDFPILHLSPLTDEEKRLLIQTCLRSSLKELSPELLDYVCSIDESGNPLYLSILLNDIKSFGSNSQLSSEIVRHGSSPLSAFSAMLDRMENDCFFDTLSPKVCVPVVFSLLALARDGLSYGELADCLSDFFPDAELEICRGSVQILLRQVRTFVCRRDGRTDLRHQLFRNAVQNRYSSRSAEFHRLLAKLFQKECDPDGDWSFSVQNQRALCEYAYHLSFVSEPDYRQLYMTASYISARCEAYHVRELIGEYASPALSGLTEYRDILIRYRSSLERCGRLFPSLLSVYGTEQQRTESGLVRLKQAWLSSKDIGSYEAETSPADIDAFDIHIISETRAPAAAFCFSKDRPTAFAFHRQGQITAYDLDSSLPISNPIYTSKSMPLGLCASEKYIAAAFESGSIELYEIEIDGEKLRSKLLHTLSYFTPMYGAAAMCFDSADRLWFQPDEEEIACYDIASGERTGFSLPGAEELSSVFAADNGIYAAACSGLNTLLFYLDKNGSFRVRDMGKGDSRILHADREGCLVCTSSSSDRNLLVKVNSNLENLIEDTLSAPAIAAVPSEYGYFLLSAKTLESTLSVWDGRVRNFAVQELLYQDQAQLKSLSGGRYALLSAVAMTVFSLGGKNGASAGKPIREKEPEPDGFPALDRYELSGTDIYKSGDYACVTGISNSAASVRDKHCAGAVFLKKAAGRWQVCGFRTWPNSMEIIRAVSIDPTNGVFTLFLRSSKRGDRAAAVHGTAEELCTGPLCCYELDFPGKREMFACCSDAYIFLAADTLLYVYTSDELQYETALVLPAPVVQMISENKHTVIRTKNSTMEISINKGGH